MKVSVLLTVILAVMHGVAAYRLVCVYTNWSQYRPEGGKFLPEDIDPSMCTHLIYVYAKLKGNKLEPSEWNDDGTAWMEGMYQRVNALKQYNPDLKILLGVGGWLMGSKDFSRMASNRRSRRMFAKSSIDFLRKRDFDGLTIDWQYPTKRGGGRRDRVNYSLLLQELRRAFDEESRQTGQTNLLLTAGVSASKYIIDSAYEVENVSKYTDFINVFAFDLHGPWDNFTGHPSPLYAREDELGPAADINIDSAMKHWISYGVDRSKLVLGISTYGRSFTLKQPRYNGYGVPTSGPGIAGDFTREPGMIAYYERCDQYFDAPRIWNKQSRVAYWHSGDQWIAGEDIESVKHKVNWVRHHGIGGIMFSSLDMDDFSGLFCTGDYYPLLDIINKQFTVPLPPLIDQQFTVHKIQPSSSTDFGFYKEEVTTPSYQIENSAMYDAAITTSTTIDPQPVNFFSVAQVDNNTPAIDKQVVVTAEQPMQMTTVTTHSPVISITQDKSVDKTKQRNERLISDLLNIFKAQGMLNMGQQNMLRFGTNLMPNRFGGSSGRLPFGGLQPGVPAVDSTTKTQPFTVHPWSTFRKQTQMPVNG